MIPAVTKDSPEIVAAAAWWASKLDHAATQVNGDPFQSAFATALCALVKPVPQAVIDSFQGIFAELLAEKINSDGEWTPEQPMWCSAAAGRTVRIDYHVHGVLLKACEAAGVDKPDLRFPIKTCMRINPGEVTVGEGYQSPWVTIYGASSEVPA